MEKWKIKFFGYRFGKDRNNEWFIRKMRNGSFRRAVHSEREIASLAWDAGVKREREEQIGVIPFTSPAKETYISTLFDNGEKV